MVGATTSSFPVERSLTEMFEAFAVRERKARYLPASEMDGISSEPDCVILASSLDAPSRFPEIGKLHTPMLRLRLAKIKLPSVVLDGDTSNVVSRSEAP